MRVVAGIVFALCLTACGNAPTQEQASLQQETTDALQPVAGASDPRAFRYLTLPNQLPVLLVSDPAADKAAAALDVAVGSGSDPIDRLGLAHYLEHMLFLGTDKYPNPDDYQQFIANHGGSQNAYTSFDHTNYFFDIAADQLEGGLDRFAQFFIAPRFDPQYVAREINAVHSEYSSKMLDDFRRGYDVFKQQLNPRHPMAKFSVGSLESLAADGDYQALRNQLMAFYQQHYSANKMRLVVYGAESLDTLQGWVEEKFSAIPNYQRGDIVIREPLFTAGALPVRVGVVPHRALRRLNLSFPVPDTQSEYTSKPFSYIGEVLGHEGEGSLLSHLKQQGWVDALSAGQSVQYRGGGMFAINMDLTPAGETNIDQIVAAVFSAVNMLVEGGVKSSLFLEQATISEQAFANREPQSPMGEVSQWASDMHDFAPRDILRGHYLLTTFDAERIRELLTYIRPDNMLLTHTSPSIEAAQQSPYFAAPYRVDPVSVDVLATWRQPPVIAAIKPPQANPFIGEHRLVEVLPAYTSKPELFIEEPGMQLWFVQDDVFRVPKGQMIIRLTRPAMAQLPARDVVLMDLMARLVSDRFNEFAYPAQIAGVSFHVLGGTKGLDIRLGGFSSGHSVLLREVLASVQRADVDERRFDRLVQDFREELQRALVDKPFRQIMRRASQLLLSPSQDLAENLAALQHLKADDLSRFMREINDAWQIEAMLAGNYSPQQAGDVADQLRALLPAKREMFQPPKVSVMALDCATPCIEQWAVDDNDSAVLVYLQGRDSSDLASVDMAILANMMQSPFFQSLRTDQQLGYIVGAYPYAMHGYPGLALLVQSPSASVDTMLAAINAFNQAFLAGEKDAVCQNFALSAAAVVTQLTEKPKNFAEQVGEYWQDLQYGELGFNSKQRLATLASQRECGAWLGESERVLSESYPRRMVLAAAGENSPKIDKKLPNIAWTSTAMGRN